MLLQLQYNIMLIICAFVGVIININSESISVAILIFKEKNTTKGNYTEEGHRKRFMHR